MRIGIGICYSAEERNFARGPSRVFELRKFLSRLDLDGVE